MALTALDPDTALLAIGLQTVGRFPSIGCPAKTRNT